MFADTSLKPIFIQIADWVEDEIIRCNIKEGDQVPSTNQFAAQFQINPATAGKGINLESYIRKEELVCLLQKERYKRSRRNGENGL